MRLLLLSLCSLGLLVLCSCATQPPGELALALGEVEPSQLEGLLTFEQAERIRIDPASSLAQLATTRPGRREYLSAVRFKIQNSDGEGPRYTLMRIRLTHHPLQYFTHVTLRENQEGVNESELSLFGVGAVVYRATFNPKEVSTPSEIRLTEGRLFSIDRSFALAISQDGVAQMTTVCRPTKRMEAFDVHHKLHGAAVVFDCTTTIEGGESFTHSMIYLDAYAQYLPMANIDVDGVPLVTFEIADVVVSYQN